VRCSSAVSALHSSFAPHVMSCRKIRSFRRYCVGRHLALGKLQIAVRRHRAHRAHVETNRLAAQVRRCGGMHDPRIARSPRCRRGLECEQERLPYEAGG